MSDEYKYYRNIRGRAVRVRKDEKHIPQGFIEITKAQFEGEEVNPKWDKKPYNPVETVKISPNIQIKEKPFFRTKVLC